MRKSEVPKYEVLKRAFAAEIRREATALLNSYI